MLRVTRAGARAAVPRLGYPWLPALYIALGGTIGVILLIADKTRVQALSGLVLVLVGIPVFFLWRKTEAVPA